MTLTQQIKSLPVGGKLTVMDKAIKRVHDSIQQVQKTTGQWYAARTLTTGVQVRRVE